MITKVPIPKLGQSEETVIVESWKVKEGDVVKKGDVLFEIETDKSVLEVESQFEGTVLKILVPVGQEVPVMTIGLILGEPGDEIPEIEAPKVAPKPEPAAKPVAESATAQVAKPVVESVVGATPRGCPTPTFKPKPSPRAKSFAKDYLINIDNIQGSGGDVNRVTEQDVVDYLNTSGYNDKKITPAAFNVAKKEELELLVIDGTGDQGRITLSDVRDAAKEKPQEFSQMRKIIAERLTQSKQEIPHFYVTTSIDITDLMTRRKELKEEGINISVNVFIMKAVALALKDFPMLNSSTDGKTISLKSKINIGIAVSLEGGLVVPVIKNADKKALDEIHAEVAELAEKARSGKLGKADMTGGTFTISNMGMLGVENFSAIINPGESAILAVSAGIKTPVVKDDKIVVKNIMKVTVSADHRAVDGADAAQFVAKVKSNIEDMTLWNTI